MLDEGVTVQRLALESSENHHLQRAGKEVALFRFFTVVLRSLSGGYVQQGLEQNSVVELGGQAYFWAD